MKTYGSLDDPETRERAWLGTVVYCAFSFLFFLYALLVWKDLAAIVIAGFFALCGVVYLVATIRMSLGLGPASPADLLRLRLENPRPVPGGRLAAAVFLPKTGRYAMVTAELTCWRTDEDAKPLEALWSGRQSAKAEPNARGAIAKIAIDLPKGLRPTALPGSSASAQPPVKWELRLSALGASFEQEGNYQVLVGAEPGAATPATAAEPATPSLGASSLWVLVAANLVPIAGAVFWGWQVGDMVFLYWLENVVIGVFTILRILVGRPDAMQWFARGGVFPEAAQGGGLLLLAKVLVIAFFVAHYGVFCLAHGAFLSGMFSASADFAYQIGFGLLTGTLPGRHVLIALGGIVASHAYSFLVNYLGRGEYRHADFAELMVRPYRRIIVTHLFILAGGLLLQALKLPLAALVLFVGLKIAFDGYFHRAERRALAPTVLKGR